jgi:hypothetical protein
MMALPGQGSPKMVRRYSQATPEETEEAVTGLPQPTGQVLKFERKTARVRFPAPAPTAAHYVFLTFTANRSRLVSHLCTPITD